MASTNPPQPSSSSTKKDFFSHVSDLLGSPSYAKLSQDSLHSTESLVLALLSHRSLPSAPWPSQAVSLFLHRLSLMDTNNYPGNVGVGEREARIFSPLVRDRNYGMGHGIGRSGDVNAVQPKAIGSSVMVKLTKHMVINAMNKILGYTFVKDALILPLATGMALALTLQTLKAMKPTA